MTRKLIDLSMEVRVSRKKQVGYERGLAVFIVSW
jgi:hypothetical protein